MNMLPTIFLFFSLIGNVTLFAYPKKQEQIHTIYGDYTITDPVLLDLIHCPTMQRLKHINQYGVCAFVKKQQEYNRYDHSVGVMALLIKFGASLEEQIAGLLHDVSHTVFSHLGDVLFKTKSGDCSYQDTIHEWFFRSTELADLLRKHGFKIKDVLHKNRQFHMLEQPSPELCADRLEYNLTGGIVENLITKETALSILDHVLYADGEWFFDDASKAKQFALIPLYLTEHIFAAPWDTLINQWTVEALRRAISLQLITNHDIHFSTDKHMWHCLTHSDDLELQNLMHKVVNYEAQFCISDASDYDVLLTGKFRGVNPWVKVNDRLVRLTELDDDFNQEFQRVNQQVTSGWYVKLR